MKMWMLSLVGVGAMVGGLVVSLRVAMDQEKKGVAEIGKAAPNRIEHRLKAPKPAPRRLAGTASERPARSAGEANEARWRPSAVLPARSPTIELICASATRTLTAPFRERE